MVPIAKAIAKEGEVSDEHEDRVDARDVEPGNGL